MKISCRKKIATDSKKEAILIPVYKNIRSLRLITGKKIDDELQKLIQSDYFNFEEKELKSFYMEVNKKFKKVYLLHIPKELEDARVYMELGAKVSEAFKKDKISSFSIISFEDIYNEKKDFSAIKGFLEGFMLRTYIFDKFKTKKTPEICIELEIITSMSRLKKYIDDRMDEWDNIFENINLMKDLINTPANHMRPIDFVNQVKEKSVSDMNLTIWGEKEILENKLNLLYSVGMGSSNETHFIHIKYEGNPESSANIAFVGKGITFDTGGTSLKPSANMHEMKCDMSGAALMFAVTRLIAMLKLRINVNTYIPLAENIIGRDALVPGDVVTSASGKTVEIMNTDAEGRLILADALFLATKTDPEVIIDAATLTGACVIALGPFCAGLFSNRKFLSKQISDISWEVGEDVWELPLFEGYEAGIDSTVADIQNMSSFGREGSSIHAAIFLKQFVDNYPWIHLDIAGPAYLDKAHPILGKEATGFGLRLLYNFIVEHYCEKNSI